MLVKQFQYTGWPEESVPDVGSGLIDVIGQVQKWQRSSGDQPIVVHCRLAHCMTRYQIECGDDYNIHCCVAAVEVVVELAPTLPSAYCWSA